MIVSRTLGVAVGVAALTFATPGTASAHGVCKTTASPPVTSLLSVSYAAAFDCSENHNDIYVRACLEKSTSALTGWTTVDCVLGHASGGNHVHAVDSASDVCIVGFYRTVALGYNGNFNHQVPDVSAPVACANL